MTGRLRPVQFEPWHAGLFTARGRRLTGRYRDLWPPDAVPIWSPIVSQFLEEQSATSTAQQLVGTSPPQKLHATPPQVSLPSQMNYSGWRKLCFESSEDTTICRITSAATDEIDQVVARVDLIQRADGPARLQLFVPQGVNLQRGVQVTVDHSEPTPVPFAFCLTNICIAADLAKPDLIAALESGKTLKLEVTDLNSSSMSLEFSLDQFAVVRKAAPAQTFDFGLDEQ
ncbi:invasion associated locus B family protein [Bradyrhizobium manausense]|uniref:invasion associated locus B family protein n=1 Tax=Bradyrhizobium manausense TaxID=989370 RepID=UPI001BAA7A3B|nr:invasion associated locus B family protein [Bradyrhizobium manausense]